MEIHLPSGLVYFSFHLPSLKYYIITQVILAFLLVLAYDLSEDRCTIDVIITEILPLPF